MTARRDALAERVRPLLPRGRALREVAMFGGRSFMVDEAMVVAAGRDGDLLVRTEPARHDELLDVVGAKPAVMGPDRPMGPGWIAVGPDGLATDEQITFWIAVGLEAAQARSRPGSR